MTGEYFLNKEQKLTKKQKEKDEKHAEANKRRDERRQRAFVPPEEKTVEIKVDKSTSVDIESLKQKVKKAQKKKHKKMKS